MAVQGAKSTCTKICTAILLNTNRHSGRHYYNVYKRVFYHRTGRTQNHPERVYTTWPFFEIHPAELSIYNRRSLIIIIIITIRRRYLNSNTRRRRYRILRPGAARWAAIRKRRDQFKWTPIRNVHNIYIYNLYCILRCRCTGQQYNIRVARYPGSEKKIIINKHARIAWGLLQYIPVGLPPTTSGPISCLGNANNRLDDIGYIY